MDKHPYFQAVESAPTNEGILAAEENYYGGVADLGDSDAAYHIQAMPGYWDYRSHLEEAAAKHLGYTFPAWRSMSQEQYDAWRNGDDIGPVSVTINPDLAQNWTKLAAVKGPRKVVQLQVPASAIVMRGRPEEHELVVDANQIELPMGKSEVDEVETVTVWAVNPRGETLWGVRRKDGKYTTPGGHLEPGERKEDGAARELYEEAGVETVGSLAHMGSARNGKGVLVHLFFAVVDGRPTSENDPDNEFQKLSYVDCSVGLPDEIAQNLAHPDNLLLKWLGLLNDQNSGIVGEG